MIYYQDKIAIVTGGLSGIGRSISIYLVKQGAKVIIADINLEKSEEFKAIVSSMTGSYEIVRVDVSNFDEIKTLVDQTHKMYKKIDFLFNNAGIGINGEFQDFKMEQIKKVMDVNYYGVINGCYSVYPIMKKQGFGHIINTSSLLGLIPGGLTSAYSASKHAVVGFSQTLRSEAKLYGIQVTLLCPGQLKTNINETNINVSGFMNSEKNQNINNNAKIPTPEKCINKIMREIKRNKCIVIAPFYERIYWLLYRLFPNSLIFVFKKITMVMKKNA
jgi:short-subunit dehydrogenase